MTIAVATAAILALAVINAGSALGKLLADPTTVEHLALAGIPRPLLPPLAAVQLVGAAMLLLGLHPDYRWAATTAAIAFTAYFLIAVARHLQVRHYRGLPAPLAALAIAAATALAIIV